GGGGGWWRAIGSWTRRAASIGTLTIAPSTCWSAACGRSSATTPSVRASSAPSAAPAIDSSAAAMRKSIFAKLLAIMITMAVALLALVTWFFMFQMLPAMKRSAEPFVVTTVQRIAQARPNLAEGKRMPAASGLDLAVRYEGPDGTWSTSPWLPRIADAPLHRGPLSFGNEYYLVRLPDGGAYLFVWNFRRRTIGAHQILLHSLLILMIVTIIVTYLVLRRMLRPVRTLGDGVARLAAGELDVTLPAPTRDELGAVTRAFNEMVGRVREMIRARDQLLLDVSHELRSPITRMRVAVELLPEGKERA